MRFYVHVRIRAQESGSLAFGQLIIINQLIIPNGSHFRHFLGEFLLWVSVPLKSRKCHGVMDHTSSMIVGLWLKQAS